MNLRHVVAAYVVASLLGGGVGCESGGSSQSTPSDERTEAREPKSSEGDTESTSKGAATRPKPTRNGPSDASTGPGLTAASANAVFKRKQTKIRRCYENYLRRNVEASGSVQLRVVIGADGRVETSKVARNRVGGNVGTCITEIVDELTFPKPSEPPSSLVKTFHFRSKN